MARASSNNPYSRRSGVRYARHRSDTRVVAGQDHDLCYGIHLLCALPNRCQLPRVPPTGISYKTTLVEHPNTW